MSTVHRIESLKSKHAQIDKRLSDESARPMPDETTVLALKRQKLQIKDEIQSLTAHWRLHLRVDTLKCVYDRRCGRSNDLSIWTDQPSPKRRCWHLCVNLPQAFLQPLRVLAYHMQLFKKPVKGEYPNIHRFNSLFTRHCCRQHHCDGIFWGGWNFWIKAIIIKNE